MAITLFRNKRQTQFTIVDKSILTNSHLSLKDRGMIVTLLFLPDFWDFSINGLCKVLPDGKNSIGESLKRIEEMGFLVRRIIRDNNGKYSRSEVEIYEIPIIAPYSDLPYPDFRYSVNRDTDFRPQYSNKISSNKKDSNKESKEILSDQEYRELVSLYGNEAVDYQINKIKKKGYYGCLNKETIDQWCNDYNKKAFQLIKKNKFHNHEQRNYSIQEYEHIERSIANKRNNCHIQLCTLIPF